MLAPVSVCVPPVSVSPPLPEMMPENRSFFASVIVQIPCAERDRAAAGEALDAGGARESYLRYSKVLVASTRLDVAIQPLLASASVSAWITGCPRFFRECMSIVFRLRVPVADLGQPGRRRKSRSLTATVKALVSTVSRPSQCLGPPLKIR